MELRGYCAEQSSPFVSRDPIHPVHSARICIWHREAEGINLISGQHDVGAYEGDVGCLEMNA